MARGSNEPAAKRVIRGAQPRQLSLAFPSRWGGARAGAGRKRGARGMVRHRARPAHAAAEPVHVTMRARIAPLRSQFVFPTVRLALLRAGRRAPTRFRILQFSVQRDHLHLIVEAQDKQALSRAIQGLAIRVARYVNDLLGRRGPLWADRWHGRALQTPREVRNALAYVLGNFRKHAAPRRSTAARRSAGLPAGIDPYSSGEWFDGWRDWTPWSGTPPPFAEPRVWQRYRRTNLNDEATARAIAQPATWLAATGWRRHGLLALDEHPR